MAQGRPPKPPTCEVLRRKQVELAMRGDKTMLIWLGKQFLGQSDKTQLSGKDDGPTKRQHSVANLTDEQLDAEIEKLLGPKPAPPEPSIASISIP